MFKNIVVNGIIHNEYVVNEEGIIKSIDRYTEGRWVLKDGTKKIFHRFSKGCEIKGNLCWNGYRKIVIPLDGVSKTLLVHRIVAETFINNPENKSDVNHKNGIKTDNRVENLEWTTRGENLSHAYRVLKIKNPASRLTQTIVNEIREKYKNGMRQCDLCSIYNISSSHMSDIVNDKNWCN